jgi:hypothetical protein
VPIATEAVQVESLLEATDLNDGQESVVAGMWKEAYVANEDAAARLRSLTYILRGLAIGGSSVAAALLTPFGFRPFPDD